MRSVVVTLGVVVVMAAIIGLPTLAQPSVSQAQPDLTPTRLDVEPSGAEPGEAVEVVAVVENQGEADADGFWVRLRVDGTIQNAQLVSGLEAGERFTWRTPWVVAPEASELTLEVDATGRVDESDETNNALTTTIGFAADLEIAELTLEPRFPKPDEAAEIRVDVRNPSRRDVERTFAVEVQAGRSTVATRFVQGIEAGESQAVTVPWTAKAGAQLIRVAVDAFDRIPESDSANNRAFVEVDVAQREATGADLAVTEVRLHPRQPNEGEIASLQATVENAGDGVASGFDVAFWADGDPVGRTTIPQLSPGESTVVSLAWTVEVGQRRLRALADAGHVVPEADEANNGQALTVDLGSGPNACGQLVYLWLQDGAIEGLMGIVGAGPETVRNLYVPQIKRVMETQYEGINVRFVYERPGERHGTVAFRPDDESPVLGRAPIGARFSTGSVFVGSFVEFGLGSFAVSRIPILVGTVASHELGHMFGLRHPSPSTGGIMDANTQLTPVPGDDVRRFRDEARQQLTGLLPMACDR